MNNNKPLTSPLYLRVAESDDECCGACKNFRYEDTDGIGICSEADAKAYCGWVCDRYKQRGKKAKKKEVRIEIDPSDNHRIASSFETMLFDHELEKVGYKRKDNGGLTKILKH